MVVDVTWLMIPRQYASFVMFGHWRIPYQQSSLCCMACQPLSSFLPDCLVALSNGICILKLFKKTWIPIFENLFLAQVHVW